MNLIRRYKIYNEICKDNENKLETYKSILLKDPNVDENKKVEIQKMETVFSKKRIFMTPKNEDKILDIIRHINYNINIDIYNKTMENITKCKNLSLCANGECLIKALSGTPDYEKFLNDKKNFLDKINYYSSVYDKTFVETIQKIKKHFYTP